MPPFPMIGVLYSPLFDILFVQLCGCEGRMVIRVIEVRKSRSVIRISEDRLKNNYEIRYRFPKTNRYPELSQGTRNLF
jgi:hypothetical protein